MEYKEIERTISSYNELVNTINGMMDNELKNNQVENAPFEAFELVKATDDDESHLPYLYLRFVYLPYHVKDKKTTEDNEVVSEGDSEF